MDDDMQAWAHALELEGQRWEHEQAAADNAEYEGEDPWMT